MKIKNLVLVLLLVSAFQVSWSQDSVNTAFNLEESLLENGYVKIEMTKGISGHLHLKGTINGVAGNFILDTGAGVTVIEQKRKDKFNMKSIASGESATGAGGTGIATQDSDNNLLVLDTLTLENTDLVLMDLDYVNQAFLSMGMKEMDGVIGADILSGREAIIDYANLVLYLKK